MGAGRKRKLNDEEGEDCNQYPYDDDDEAGSHITVYDEDGYDENGYDENGYDEHGYDEDGYDENGYDEDGYDEDGYDEDSYDEDGRGDGRTATGIAHRLPQPANYMLNLYGLTTVQGDGPQSITARDDNNRKRPGRKRKRQRRRPGPSPPRPSSRLETSPVEVAHCILLDLDIVTLMTLRNCSSRCRALVSTLPAYRLLWTHANHTLQVVLSLTSNVATTFSVRHLFIELCQPTCSVSSCSAFGPYVFLPTFRRCCNYCLQNCSEFQVLPLSFVNTYFAIPPRTVTRAALPIIHCPLDLRSYGRTTMESPCRDLVSVERVEQLGVHCHGGMDQMLDIVRKRWADQRGEYNRKMDEWQLQYWARSHVRRPRRPRCFGLLSVFPVADWLSEWSCQGATDLPFWDTRKQQAESGVYCSACSLHSRPSRLKYTDDRGRRTHRACTLDAIVEHFASCSRVDMGYEMDQGYWILRSKGTGPDFLVDESGEAVQDESCVGEKFTIVVTSFWVLT